MSVRLYICVCVSVCVSMCVQIYVYTDTHVHTYIHESLSCARTGELLGSCGYHLLIQWYVYERLNRMKTNDSSVNDLFMNHSN